ncbi:hypothetical protein IV73_GL001222 [Weissella kandleri]|uniref:Extracellular matrix-binding protein ebh GA module domain-containing protein n=1 Tax=Weissella kandleri TaxID=1616 RepID=A0A0R2JBQ1_9LACO|nr:hypothetical protein IV73_GL001222 [Weissella kandleri]
MDAAKAADQKAGADKLAEEKKTAIDQINNLKNLNQDQKKDYINQVNNAKTADEITKIVDAAKAADQKAGADKLAEEKKTAIDQINKDKTLNENQKHDFINQIKNAETSSDLGKIMQQTNLPQTDVKNQLTIGALISIVLGSIFSLSYVLEKKRK